MNGQLQNEVSNASGLAAIPSDHFGSRRPWRLSQGSSPGNNVFTRPLGPTETSHYWDAAFSGMGDTLQHISIRLTSPDYLYLFTEQHLNQTWCCIKRRFPLLGSSIVEAGSDQHLKFVIEESRLRTICPADVSLRNVNSSAETEDFINTLINGPRQLSPNLPARLYVLSRTDTGLDFHVLVHVCHIVTDGIANAVILREFCELLCNPEMTAFPPLRSALQDVVPMEDFFPTHRMSRAQQKWRWAVAKVICESRRQKLSGGHMLPGRTKVSLTKPALSCLETLCLSESLSGRILNHCKKLRITLSHALPVISQVAQARVLHRLWLRGQISDIDWQNRKKQPMYFEGSVNLRAALYPNFFSEPRTAQSSVFVSSFVHVLPFMPTPKSYRSHDDVALPGDTSSFSKWMSRERFISRSRLIKKQGSEILKNPLFLELSAIRNTRDTWRSKKIAVSWNEMESRKNTFSSRVEDNIVFDVDHRPGVNDPIMANNGGSMGNIDSFLPLRYPLRAADGIQKPTMFTVNLSTNRLRCRPGELYLGAYTTRQRVKIFVFWDGNIFDRGMICEWITGVKEAFEWYLGQDDQETSSKGTSTYCKL